MHPDNPLWTLNFDVDYFRRKQTDRLVAHLEAGNPIWAFTGNEAEYAVDSLLNDIKKYIDSVEKERQKRESRKFWKRKK